MFKLPWPVRNFLPDQMQVRNHLCEMVTGKRRELPVVCKEKDKGLEWEPSASNFKHDSLAELRIYGRFKAEENFARLKST
mgnify:CR=1 FL=1